MYENIKEKWAEFFDMKSDVRTVTQVYWSPMAVPERPWPFPDREEERIAWALKRYEAMEAAKKIIDDDQIPFLAPYTGTEIFAEAFGCKVHYPVDNMPFALPKIHSASEVRSLRRPSRFAPPLERTFRIARRLREVYPDAPMQLPDIQSPFDIAALIWAKEDFYAATIEEPEAVEDLCAMIEELLVKFLDTWLAEFGTAHMAHYPDYYVPVGVTLSEDEAGSISPAAFKRFCLPALGRLSKRYGGIGVHCCANSINQWSNFRQIPDLFLLNLNQPASILRQSFPVFADCTAQMPAWLGDGYPSPAWKEHLPDNAHIVLYGGAATEDEAKRLLEAFRTLRD